MSSSPPRKGIEFWSLRRRLIFEQVVLLTIVCIVIVGATEIALRPFLVGQLDGRLTEAGQRFLFTDGPGSPPPGGLQIKAAQQPAGTLGVQIEDGEIKNAAQWTSSGGQRQVPESAYETLLAQPVNPRPHYLDLGDFGLFRVTVTQAPPLPGRGETIVVTGLPMSEVDSLQLNVGLIMGAVALIGLLAAGGAGALIVRRALEPLQRVAATATRVAELPLDQGEVELAERVPKRYTDPNTEVGQVGLALNRMLGNVQDALTARHESETRVRQFVADASHELRTPLAAVLGYAELIRRRDDDVAPEVAHALGRVESEATRMSTLVEDLLLLARLDSGRPLEHADVDLSRLVVDVLSDARVAGPDHTWRLDLPAAPVVAPGDDARLHQVLANLLSNSRTHTPPGTTITVSLGATGDTATLTVHDDGPGIPADLLPDVFERFARGDSSRSRAAGSTGLGLAIVAAVVNAHDGQVWVDSEPGSTTFTVHLPRRTAAAQD